MVKLFFEIAVLNNVEDTVIKKQTRPLAQGTYITVILTINTIFIRSVIIALETNMPGLEDWWWVDGRHICQFVGHDVSED